MRTSRVLPLLAALSSSLVACGAPAPGANDTDAVVTAPRVHVGSSGSGGAVGTGGAGGQGPVAGSGGWTAVDDPFEDNDDESKAATLPVGGASALWLGDPDWYRLDLGACGASGYVSLDVLFDNSAPAKLAEVVVKDGAGNERARTKGPLGFVQLRFSLAEVGTDLRIGVLGEPLAYQIGYDASCDGGSAGAGGGGGGSPPEDTFEPNNTPQEAKPLGDWAGLSSNDPDWFTFDTACAHTASMSWSTGPKARDKTIEVTTPNGSELSHHGPLVQLVFSLEGNQKHTIGVLGSQPGGGSGESYFWQSGTKCDSGGGAGAGGSGGGWGGGGSGQGGNVGTAGFSSGGAAGASAGAGGGAGSGTKGGAGGAAGSSAAGGGGVAGAGAGGGAGGQAGGSSGAAGASAGGAAGAPGGNGGSPVGAGASAGAGAAAGGTVAGAAGAASAAPPDDDGGAQGGGCSVGPSRSRASFPLAALGALGLVLARRRKRAS